MVTFLFQLEMMNQIAALPISHGTWSDQLCRERNRTQRVRLTGMYYLMRQPEAQLENSLFQGLWKLEVPMRVKTFWWRLLCTRLPCKELLCHRNIIPMDQRWCDLCTTNIEDCYHVYWLVVQGLRNAGWPFQM